MHRRQRFNSTLSGLNSTHTAAHRCNTRSQPTLAHEQCFTQPRPSQGVPTPTQSSQHVLQRAHTNDTATAALEALGLRCPLNQCFMQLPSPCPMNNRLHGQMVHGVNNQNQDGCMRLCFHCPMNQHLSQRDGIHEYKAMTDLNGFAAVSDGTAP